MGTRILFFVLTFLARQGHAHFVLQLPTSLGFDDANEANAPCGGSFDIKNRDKVTVFPTGGYPFHVLSTHTKSIFQYRAALLNSTTDWVDLLPPIGQSGVGDFCLPAVPGHEAWAGLDAVVQVAQFGPDGTLFQCAAVKFIAGPAFDPPASCKNSSRVLASVTSVIATLPSGTGTLGVFLNTKDSEPIQTGAFSSTTTTATYATGPTSSVSPVPTSGASIEFKIGSDGRLWTMIVALLGAWVFLVSLLV